MGEILDRFWSKVEVRGSGDCWEWQAGRGSHGYGNFYPRHGESVLAHRFALSLIEKPPRGAHALHSCDNKKCVNPEHLRWGSHAENMRDAAERGRSKPGRTLPDACPAGHVYDAENTLTKRRRGTHGASYVVHSCRECNRQYCARRRARRAATRG